MLDLLSAWSWLTKALVFFGAFNCAGFLLHLVDNDAMQKKDPSSFLYTGKIITAISAGNLLAYWLTGSQVFGYVSAGLALISAAILLYPYFYEIRHQNDPDRSPVPTKPPPTKPVPSKPLVYQARPDIRPFVKPEDEPPAAA
jgi:hypothetical protein